MTMYPITQQREERKEDKSVGELLTTLTQDLVTLVRQEMMLAKTEMSHKVANVTKNLGVLAAGGALAYAGVLALVAAIVLLLINVGMPPWLAALIVGIVVTGIGGFLVKTGIDAIRKEDLTPHKTIESLKELKNG